MTDTLASSGLPADIRWLRRLVGGLVADPHAADDIVQDTLVTALQTPARLVHRPRAWLTTVARNLAHRRARRESRRHAVEQAASRSEEHAPFAELERARLLRSVIEELLCLPEPYRRTLVLRVRGK